MLRLSRASVANISAFRAIQLTGLAQLKDSPRTGPVRDELEPVTSTNDIHPSKLVRLHG